MQSLSIILAIGWVFAATVVAMLPMRYQIPPGFVLLFSAPVVIVWLGYDFGWFVSVLALAAFVSMFRNPLRHFWNKWRGKQPSGGAS